MQEESATESILLRAAAGDEREMDGKVLDAFGFGKRVTAAKIRKRPAARERLERRLRRAGIDENDSVRGAKAEVEPHVGARDLLHHRVVTSQELLRIAAESPDRRVHRSA